MIGDEFSYRTSEEYFKNNKTKEGTYNSYKYANFEVREYFTDSQSDKDQGNSVAGHLTNQLIKALNSHSSLPKLIVCVLDDDILRGTRYHGLYFKQVYNHILEELINMFQEAIERYKLYLPAKAKRAGIPHVLWISPPTHMYFHKSSNAERLDFSNCLHNIIAFTKNMSALR